MAGEQSRKHVIMQTAVKATKEAIMTVREVKFPVNNEIPMYRTCIDQSNK